MTTHLGVHELRVTYPGPPSVRAVDGVDFTVDVGECLGVIGESGSGKSTLARTILGLNDEARIEGSITLGGSELTRLDEAAWRDVRWRRVALVFQSTTALNPVLRVSDQVAEPLEVHGGETRRAARRQAAAALAHVGLAPSLGRRYPHELSGGQRRLVLLAMALVCQPELLILDEPTAGLDPLTRRHVLDLLREEHRVHRRTLVVLSHDVDAIARLADRTIVMYRGSVAEHGPTAAVLDDPRHPYTFGLLNARPTLGTLKDLRGIRGTPPDPTQVPPGCGFADRCTQAIDSCHDGPPPLEPPTDEHGDRVVACIRGGLVHVIRARGLHKHFSVREAGNRRVHVPAVSGVDVDVREGETVGLVGPNGAGKSTLGHLLLRLLEPDAGTVHFEGVDLLAADAADLRGMRRRGQMLFQNPAEALSARLTIRQAVREPLDVQQVGVPSDRDEVVASTLDEVRLPSTDGFLDRHTHELSGGQLQRVALARALVLQPKLLVADEPLEGLDPSEQARMLQLLKALQVERGMAMVLVSHDLAVILRAVDRVLVLDEGRVVEANSGTRLLTNPVHPTTRRLLEAAGASPFMSEMQDPSSVEVPGLDEVGVDA